LAHKQAILWMGWNSRKSLVGPITRRKSYWANVFCTSYCWWTLLLLPLTYYHTRRDLFRTSPDCWRHRASNISSYLWNIGITTWWHRMGHVHVGNMYRSRRKEAKEFLCDSFNILLSFESKNVMGKILRRYVTQYTTSTHHEWRHYRRCLQRHPTTPRGQISVDEQKLAWLSKNAAHFVIWKNVVCQSAIELDYDRDVLHGYVDQNLPLLNIC
jgi:hypothetical protein